MFIYALFATFGQTLICMCCISGACVPFSLDKRADALRLHALWLVLGHLRQFGPIDPNCTSLFAAQLLEHESINQRGFLQSGQPSGYTAVAGGHMRFQ